MSDYEAKAFEIAAKSCARCGQEPDMIAAIAAFGRECAAAAYEDGINIAWSCDTGMPSASLVAALKAKAISLRTPAKEGSRE